MSDNLIVQVHGARTAIAQGRPPYCHTKDIPEEFWHGGVPSEQVPLWKFWRREALRYRVFDYRFDRVLHTVILSLHLLFSSTIPSMVSKLARINRITDLG